MARGWRLLHLTPHLGGGVGRALVSLAQGDALRPAQAPRRTVLCLEPPEKGGAVRQLHALGVEVLTLQDMAELDALARQHDLLQCEVWNHPRMFAAWAQLRNTPVRMVLWCHVSGLHFPRLPQALWQQPFPVVLTAPCSLQMADAAFQSARAAGQVHVISSAAGFEHWPRLDRSTSAGPCRLGYLGSLNPSKMHPQYVDWMASAAWTGLSMEVLGDEVRPGALQRQCEALGRPGLLQLRGFCDDVAGALRRWDVMPYLLNPTHFGTAELALLEAMTSGVLPIVMNNPCERDLVQHGHTGWVVDSPQALDQALRQCRQAPAERQHMAQQASQWVRDTFTTERQSRAFGWVHEAALALPRQCVDWPALIGDQPWQWFQCTQPGPQAYVPGRVPLLPQGHALHAHLERTKGSVHHFAACHPQDATLQAWSKALSALPESTVVDALEVA